jgi:hypothetical protein
LACQPVGLQRIDAAGWVVIESETDRLVAAPRQDHNDAATNVAGAPDTMPDFEITDQTIPRA